MKIYLVFLLLLLVGFLMPVYADDGIEISVNKSVYFLRDTVVINGNLDKIIPDEDVIKFEILNPHGIVVDRFQIEIVDNDLDFTHRLSLIESIWNEDGLYRIRANYDYFLDTAYFHVFQSDTGLYRQIDSTIGLHQEQYSWTDEVEIFVVAPNFNTDNDVVEKIGTGGGNQLEL